MKPAIRLLAVFLAISLVAPVVGASCAPFLQVVADDSKVSQGNATATYAVVVTNGGPNSQGITADTLCNSPVSCSLPDFNGPLTIASGASTTFHVNAYSQSPGNYSIPLQVFGGTGAGSSCLEARALTLQVIASNSTTSSSTLPALSVTVSPTRDIAGQPGDTIDFTLVVQNNKPETQFVEILHTAAQGNFFAESTFANAEQFKLSPGDAQTVSVQITIPPGTPGGIYTAAMKVRGVSSSGSAYDFLLTPSIFVFSPTLAMQWASTPGGCLNAFQESQSTAFLTARNLGELNGPFEAVLETPFELQGALKLSDSTFELNKLEAKTLVLSLNASKQILPGSYGYTVKIKYLNSVALRFDSCVNLQGLSGIDALPAEKFEVVRGATRQVFFSVSNNGTLAANYSIDFNPLPLVGTALTIEPSNFRLAGGQTQLVKATVFSNVTSPLGEHLLPLTLRTSTQTTQYSLVLSIVSSNKTGQSPLEITSSQYRAVEGLPTQYAVTVRNNGFADFGNVQLAVEGLPVDWVNIGTPSQAIARSQQKDFLVTFNVPAGTNKQQASQLYAFMLHAVAGFESVSTPAVLESSTPVKKMDFAVEQVSQQNTADGSKLFLRVAVYNQGNVVLSSIQASLPFSSEYTITSSNPLLRLGPSGREYINLEVAPVTTAKEQDVFLRLQSDEGAEKTTTLKLPALSKSGSADDSSLGWKAIAVVVLIVAIMAALAREDIEQMLHR